MSGRPQTQVTREKIRAALKGRKRPPRSAEWCRKLSLSKKGKPAPHMIGNKNRLGMKNSKKQIEAARLANLGNKHFLGRKHTPETLEKMSIVQKARGKHGPSPKTSGPNNWNWKGGISPERTKAYFTQEYKDWRKSIFERDNYTCVFCGVNRNNQGNERVELSADHIKPWSEYPDLRYDLDNGRTLCVPCHRKTPTYGVKKKTYAN